MLSAIEKAVLAEEAGSKEPQLIIRTRTRIDTGRWWLRSRLCLLVMEDELVILAAKRRRYIERVPFSECADSHYCHDSGCLVIGPAEGVRFNQIEMPVSSAIKVLRLIGVEP